MLHPSRPILLSTAVLIFMVRAALGQGCSTTLWQAGMAAATSATQKGDVTTAESEFQRAIWRATVCKWPDRLGASDFELGSLYVRNGRPVEAIPLLEEAWGLAGGIRSASASDRGRIVANLAAAYIGSKQWADAAWFVDQIASAVPDTQGETKAQLLDLIRSSVEGIRESGRPELADRLAQVVSQASGGAEPSNPRAVAVPWAVGQSDPAPPTDPDVASGLAALRAPDVATAIQAFSRAAERGEARARYELARLLLWEESGHYDPKRGAALLKKAAEQGYVPAQTRLADVLDTGELVRRNVKAAFHWALVAAEHGDALAQNHVGLLYRYGDGTSVNYAESVRWFRASAAQREAWGEMNLACMYFSGLGVEKNVAEAGRLFLLAARGGVAVAAHNTACMYRDGDAFEKDLVESFAWFHATMLLNDPGKPYHEMKRLRDDIGRQLTPEDRDRAFRLGESYLKSMPQDANNWH